MNHYDMIVIGAGISGLSMAHFCARQGLRTLVLEGSGRVGGSMHSHHFGGAADGFWVELGAHSCFNSYGNLLGIMEELDLLDLPVERATSVFRMWVNQELKTVRSQLSIPELLFALPHLFTARRAGRSVGDFYGSIVGRNNYRRVFSPAFAAVLCQPADGVPADMMFRRKPRRREVPKSFTVSSGLQTIPERIAVGDGLTVSVGRQVHSLSRHGVGFQVGVSDATDYTSDRVTVATPVDVAADLLRTVAPEIAARLARARTATVASVGVAVNKADVALPAVAGVIGRDADFYSIVSRDTLDHPEFRGFTFHFKPGALNSAARLDRAAQVLGCDRGAFVDVCEKESRLPAPALGHHELVTEVDGLLAGTPLAITGNYFMGVSIEDCVTRSRMEVERLLA